MDIAFLIIAVIGLLALTGGGGSLSGSINTQQGVGGVGGIGGVAGIGAGGVVTGSATAPSQTYVGPAALPAQSTVYTPVPASSFSPPMTPSTNANVTGELITGSAAIGTSVLAVTKTVGSALPIVGAAIAVMAAVAAALLAAHKKRLTDAKNENAAVDQWIPVFDSFVTSVVNAYNSKQINAQQAASICQQFDQVLYSKFKSFVGQTGTAWSDASGMAGKCDKTCTVGCCVYYGDLGPVLNNMSFLLGYPTGKWGQGDPRISGRTITCPKVYPSKYSSYTRALYTVTLS